MYDGSKLETKSCIRCPTNGAMYGSIAGDIATADACIVTFDSILDGCGVRPVGSR